MEIFIHPDFVEIVAGLATTQGSNLIKLFLPSGPPGAGVHVVRGTLPGTKPGALDVYFKLYEHPPGEWRFWGRASKARREYENYQTFVRLGVPAAKAIVWGEHRDSFGRLRRAFIVTETIPQSVTLTDFFRGRPSRPERAAVLRQLVEITNCLHTSRFYGRSLLWRNLIVSRASNPPRVHVIDCPRGGRAWFGRSRRQLRDLATLDQSGVEYCSRTERLRFLLAYLRKPRLDAAARQMIRDAIEYRRNRWPEKWHGH